MNVRDLRPWVEQRVQDATAEAKAFADNGLYGLSGAIRGLGNAVKEARRIAEEALGKTDDSVKTAENLARMAQESVRAAENSAKAAEESAKIAENAVSIAEDARRQVETMSGQLLEVRHSTRQEMFDTIGAARQEVSDTYDTQLRNIERRIEFVRTEVMYEVQALAARAGVKANGDKPTSRIIDAAKFDAARKTLLKLNVGCGHAPLDGYVNVDSRELPSVDVVADALHLPVQPGEADEIMSSHLVEHFSVHILEAVVLPYWQGLLKPGGQLVTVAPDGAAMLTGVQNGSMTFEDFREVLFGGQDYEGDFHFNLLTPTTFSAALAKAGFVDIQTIYEGRRNGKCFEFRMAARKA